MQSSRLRRLLLSLALLAAWPAQAKVYDPVAYTLPNGLQIIVVPNHRAPVVHQMLWYRVGSIDEAAGQSGLAHYLEHLMFKGTPATPAGAFSKAVAAVGGNDNAFTSYDYTGYFATIPADFLPRLMAMEADRMQNLVLTPELAKPELAVVLAERRQRTDDDPDGRFREKFNRAVYGDYPYGRPVIGWRDEVAQMTDKTATAFYRKWYAPNNAVLIVSGDVEPAQVRALAQSTFGRIAARELPARPDFTSLYKPRQQPETLFIQDADVQQVSLTRRYAAPTYLTARPGEAYALQVLEQIIDGGAVGRLYRTLVMDEKLATETGASYDPLARGIGSFTFGVTLPPQANIGKTTAALDEMIAGLAKEGVTQQEVDRAIKRLREQAIFSRDRLMSPGYAFGQYLSVGLKAEDVESWPEKIGKVTVAEVNAAARALFTSPDYVTGYLMPDRKKNFLQPQEAAPPSPTPTEEQKPDSAPEEDRPAPEAPADSPATEETR